MPDFLPALSLALDMYRALTVAPRLLAGGVIKSLTVECSSIPLTTREVPRKSQLILADGTSVPLDGFSDWSIGGERYTVFVFEVQGYTLAGVIKQDYRNWVDIWGPFPTVEAAHRVIGLINAV